jgi:hypothetical protein
MRTVRRQSYHQGIRVGYIAPSYVRTVIQSEAVYNAIQAKGIEFAPIEGCLAAVMRMACDKKINGKQSQCRVSDFSNPAQGVLLRLYHTRIRSQVMSTSMQTIGQMRASVLSSSSRLLPCEGMIGTKQVIWLD